MEDPWNKTLLSGLVLEKGLVERLESEGKCIEFNGKIVSREQFNGEYQEMSEPEMRTESV